MVVQLDIRHNVEDIRQQLKTNRTDQLPFAMALALTRTAQRTKAYLIGRMQQVFDRPTPYTLNSLYVVPATKTNLRASVGIKDFAAKGTPAERYLRPEIEGGPRNLKRSERALQAKGLLPPGMFAVPAIGAELDAYGNMSAGQIVGILASLEALPGTAYTNIKTKRAKRVIGTYVSRDYFVAMPGGHLKPGIYERLSPRHIVPVMIFVRPPEYSIRFDMYADGQTFANSAFNEELASAWSQAIATAR